MNHLGSDHIRTEGFIEIPPSLQDGEPGAQTREQVRRTFSPERFRERVEQAIGSRTYGDLARMTGVNKETIRRHVSTGSFSFDTFTRLCEALGVSADWLLFGGPDDVSYLTRGEALRSVPFPELLHAIADELTGTDGSESPHLQAPDVSIEFRRRNRSRQPGSQNGA